MGYVGNQTTNSYTSLDKQTITGDGGASYTLDHAVANENEIEVFVNNVRQEPSVAYTVSGTALTMTGNVAASDDFYVVFQGKAIQTTVHPSGQPLQASTGSFTGGLTVDTDTLYVDSTNNRVGIATASPSQPLHVKGGAVRFENTQDTYLQVNTTDTHLYTADSHALRLGTNSTERMRLDSGGLQVGANNTKHAVKMLGGANGSATMMEIIDGKAGAMSSVTIDVQVGGAGGYLYEVQAGGTGQGKWQAGGGYTNDTNNFSHTTHAGSGWTVTSPSTNKIRLVCSSVGTHPMCYLKFGHGLTANSFDIDDITITWA